MLVSAEPHSDPSIVDRLWSIQPILFVWHFYFSGAADQFNARLFLMALIVSLWGGRLTANFWLKGALVCIACRSIR